MCFFFSNSEEDTVNLEHGIVKTNAKTGLESIWQTLHIQKAVWELK